MGGRGGGGGEMVLMDVVVGWAMRMPGGERIPALAEASAFSCLHSPRY